MAQVPLPYDPLTPLDPREIISAKAVRLLRNELYSNAEHMKTTLGGGQHGHLGLFMPPDVYAQLSDTPYVLPSTPPPPPLWELPYSLTTLGPAQATRSTTRHNPTLPSIMPWHR
jgi:hypothetical protein